MVVHMRSASVDRQMENGATMKLPVLQKLSCGSGHVLNDAFRQISFSFEMLYLIKVIGLSGSQVGLIMMLGQICDGGFSPVLGYLSDAVTLPLISRPLGKRKAWHLIGVVLLSISFPLLFARCLPCSAEVPHSWLAFSYFLLLHLVASAAFSIMDIGHLSIISVVAKTQDEATDLTVLRTLFGYGSGICAYGVAWIVFGQDSGADLNPHSWKNFLLISCTMAGVGMLFSGFIFHSWTKEPIDALPRRKVSSVLTKHGLISAAMIFIVGSDLGDAEEDEFHIVRRKTSFPLRKVSQFSQAANTRKTSRLPEDTSTASVVRRESSASRKLSAAQRISAYLVPFDTGLVEHESEHEPDDKGLRKVSVVWRKLSSLSFPRSSCPGSLVKNEQECQGKQENGDTTAEQKQLLAPEIKPELEQKEMRKSSFPQKVVTACHAPVIDEANKSSPKSRTLWLKDPHLYKVSFIYAFTRLIQDASYSYMAFYLTDHLLFQKEATAYFPLILLVSGLFGTAIAKLLNKKLGGKWTYCISAALVVGAAVWFYFLAPSSRSVAYAPTIIVGSGMSAMYVMALNFITALIGDDKETSGFVCSVAGLVAKFSSGAFFIAVQHFYPSSEGEECPDCGAFARHVLALSLGILSLLGLLNALIFQKSGDPLIHRHHKPSSSRGNVRKIGLAELYPRSTIEPQVTYETVV